MTIRAAFYRPGENTPYAQVYRPTSPPPPGTPVILGGSLSLIRPGFPDTGTLRLSAPLAFTPGDWVRVWLSPEQSSRDPWTGQPHADYLGWVASESWTEGDGEVALRPLMDRVNKSAWRGKVEGDLLKWWPEVLSRANLPKGIRQRIPPPLDARFATDTPFELLGDTVQAITPALGGYRIGVSSEGVIEVWKPSSEVTHRFVLGQAETPQGDVTNYANCVRFSFELPSGDTGWFEGKNGPEVDRRGEVWTVEQLTAREVGLPDEPLKGVDVEVQQAWRIGGQHVAELSSTVPLDKVGTPLRTTGFDHTPQLSLTVPTGSYVPENLPPDPTPAQIAAHALAVSHNEKQDVAHRVRFDVGSDVSRAAQSIREWLLAHGKDIPTSTIYSQMEIKLKVSYTRLGKNDGPVEALTVQQIDERGTHSYTGDEYMDALEIGPDFVILSMKINPSAVNAAPVTQVPVEGSGGALEGGNNSTPTPTANPEYHRLALTYTPAYRNALVAAGLTPAPIRLLAGGQIGGVMEGEGVPPEPLFYAPHKAGIHYLDVKSIELLISDPLTLNLPLPLPLSDKDPLEYAQLLTTKAGATMVTLPDTVNLPAGSAVLVSLPAGASLGAVQVLPKLLTAEQRAAVSGYRATTGADGNATPLLSMAEATYVYATTHKLGRALPSTDNPPPGQARFTVRGEDAPTRVLLLNGVNDLTGQEAEEQAGLQLLTPQLDNVQTYAAELLRYRAQPVRDWRGFYSTLKRVSVDGVAVFERLHGEDELLDVQRVTYNLTDWRTEVQAGTPLPATDEDAVAGVIESVRRVQRRAGEKND